MNAITEKPAARSQADAGHRGDTAVPHVSVVMPVYNVETYVADAIRSVLTQTYRDFELIIVDDGGSDGSVAICERFQALDSRVVIVRQRNRGLAGARNTGIRAARGRYIALLDSDDLWTPDKLALHVAHLDAEPDVGVSYSSCDLIDEAGRRLGVMQTPKLDGVDAVEVICRNPVSNGSNPVLRRQVFDAIAFPQERDGAVENGCFDETFRQSEDIECWVRIALQTQWRFAGLAPALTLYRVNAGGLSADLEKQYASWERMIDAACRYAPDFVARWGGLARAFQWRYLARRAVRMRDADAAFRLAWRALRTDPRILSREPARTLLTLAGATLVKLLPASLFAPLERCSMRLVGGLQRAGKNA